MELCDIVKLDKTFCHLFFVIHYRFLKDFCLLLFAVRSCQRERSLFSTLYLRLPICKKLSLPWKKGRDTERVKYILLGKLILRKFSPSFRSFFNPSFSSIYSVHPPKNREFFAIFFGRKIESMKNSFISGKRGRRGSVFILPKTSSKGHKNGNIGLRNLSSFGSEFSH